MAVSLEDDGSSVLRKSIDRQDITIGVSAGPEERSVVTADGRNDVYMQASAQANVLV
jgi:hypothetical protein